MSRDQELSAVARHTDDTVADLPLTGSSGRSGDVNGGAAHRDALTVEQVDLSTDPFDDNLADQLAARQPRRLISRATFFVGGAVLIVGGFLGGVLVQKNFGTAPSSAVPAGAAAGANARGFGGAGGAGAGGQAGGAQGGTSSPATTGTVKLVDGTTIYLTTADGQVITVKTSGSTAVRVQQSVTLKDLAAGATVTVQGTAGADGTITATQVTSQK
jgi:hypothetical protein